MFGERLYSRSASPLLSPPIKFLANRTLTHYRLLAVVEGRQQSRYAHALWGGIMKSSVGSLMAAGMICFALAMPVSAQRASFTVGTATAAAGQKADGYIQVPAAVDAGTNIPVVVVNGAKAGPVLALVTGAHGTEYVS